MKSFKEKKKISKRVLKENIQLGTLTIPVVVLTVAFSYLPMFGTILAFKDYKVPKGILGSDWCTPLFKNFEFFLISGRFFIQRVALLGCVDDRKSAYRG